MKLLKYWPNASNCPFDSYDLFMDTKTNVHSKKLHFQGFRYALNN